MTSKTLWPVEISATKGLDAVVQMAKQIIITSATAQDQARAHLKVIREASKKLAEDIGLLKRPHLDFNKAVDEAVKPWKDLLAATDAELQRKIIAYDEFVEEEQRIAQAKALVKWERDVARKEAKAEAKGQPVPLVAPPPVFMPPAKTVSLAGASQTTAVRHECEFSPPIIDGSVAHVDLDTLTYEQSIKLGLKIPARFFVLDRVAVRKVVLAGGDVPGFQKVAVKSITQKAS